MKKINNKYMHWTFKHHPRQPLLEQPWDAGGSYSVWHSRGGTKGLHTPDASAVKTGPIGRMASNKHIDKRNQNFPQPKLYTPTTISKLVIMSIVTRRVTRPARSPVQHNEDPTRHGIQLNKSR